MILTELFKRQAQPLSGFVPSRKWLEKGLELVFVGDQMVWSRSQTGGCLTLTKTGTPKTRLTKFGRLPGFGSTYGTGTTDRLDGGILPRPSTGWRSIVAHYWANSTGGGGLGRIFQDVSGGGLAAGEALWTSNGISYGLYGTTTSGSWYAGTLATGRWQSAGVTHDQRTVNLVPVIYLDGTSASVTTSLSASGSYQTTPCNMVWGNRPSDGARVWDGIIGPTLIFDGALTADDHFELDRNPWQVFETDFAELWVQPAGGTTITCTVGNASAAGVTAAVNASIAATVGNATAAGVTANVNAAIQTSTGDAVASGVAANVNTTIQTTTGNATAAGVTATISSGGNVTITCSVGNAAASGTAALLNTSIVCSIGNAGAAGVTALIQSGVIISASVGNAVAAGITALLHKTIQTSTGNAVAAGITASISGAAGQQVNAPRRNRNLTDSVMHRPSSFSTRHRPWH